MIVFSPPDFESGPFRLIVFGFVWLRNLSLYFPKTLCIIPSTHVCICKFTCTCIGKGEWEAGAIWEKKAGIWEQKRARGGEGRGRRRGVDAIWEKQGCIWEKKKTGKGVGRAWVEGEAFSCL